MPKDKYTATWVSHTSISDFLSCPRAYYLKHMYKSRETGHKMKIMTSALALGQAVHETLEALSTLKREDRFVEPLPNRFERAWQKVAGERGGFRSEEEELSYKKRGSTMIARVYNHPGPIARPAIKIKNDLPYFWLSEEDNIILCGKVDWLEYLPDTDSVHIIDFKTGKRREDPNSLQLPIYHLLVDRCQNHKVERASYWYLEEDDNLTPKELPSLIKAEKDILEIAYRMKFARQLKNFVCPRDGQCYECTPLERVVRGEGKLVGVDDYGCDIFTLPPHLEDDNMISVIL